MLKKLCLLALAGGVGTLTRYGLAGFIQRWMDSGYPWGTTVVNVSGCLLFGIIWSMAEERFLISSEGRSILLIGFMGAFTTFSTYIFGTGELLRDSEWILAAANILLQTTLGLIGFFGGLGIGRIL